MTAKRKPAKRKPAVPKPEIVQEGQTSYRPLIVGSLACLVFTILGAIGGVYSAGGINITPPPVVDVLARCHEADRASQVRILREFAGKQFASDAEAQKWINEQRATARTADWIPYTDALGEAIFEKRVPQFADELEGKR